MVGPRGSGKSQLLLDQLAIPFRVVFDADRGPSAAALDREIRRAAGDAPLVRLEPDFEAAAGIASRDDKVLHAWRRFVSADAATVPPALARLVERATGLLTRTSARRRILSRRSG